jgi:multidrug resistance efflux pump
MRKINIFYWIIFPLSLYAIYSLNIKLRLSHEEFYGFAENKQNEVNLDKDVTVSKIYVKTGDQIRKGELLMRVFNNEMKEEINQLDVAIGGAQIKTDQNIAEIRAEILGLEQEKSNKMAELQSKINVAEKDFAFYSTLMKNNAGKNVDSATDIQNPKVEYIKNLREELISVRVSYDNQISHFRKMISAPQETRTLKNQWNIKKNYLKAEEGKFDVVAPYDGVVGNINVREGENIKAFSSLVSFYESSPPLVLGYILEKYDVRLNIGDSVSIHSVYNPTKKVTGIIASKGNRIVEIPEKFRKIQDVKIYGIEIFIHIPSDNQFLQKETLKISFNQ